MRLVDLPSNPIPPGAILHAVPVGALTLRVARWAVPPGEEGGRGTVVVLPGRSEFIEKYAEVVADLRARGFCVVVIDWRGQGGSSRLLDNARKGHVGTFGEYRDDLDAVARAVLVPHCPRPFVALAHSMGGAIVLDHVRLGGSLFDCVVLSAPMVEIYGIQFMRLARLVAAAMAVGGLGTRYVPGGSDTAWMARPFAGNGLTSDERRFAIFNALAAAAPDLVLGAPTFGWLHAAFRVMRDIRRAAARGAIGTPALVVACGTDRVVATPATGRLAAALPGARYVVIADALHEVLMERDAVRDQFWAAFDAFVPGCARATVRVGE